MRHLVDLGSMAVLSQAKALETLSRTLDEEFAKAVLHIVECKGRVIVSGVGKSGHIAKKGSSTFSSVGIKSYFLHPTEASHGDLGMLGEDDLLIEISKSGESNEFSDVLKHSKLTGIEIIAITSNRASTLGMSADICLELPAHEESCPLGLAPTTSTTMTLSLLDALATTIVEIGNFTKEQFGKFHPAGMLGRRLRYVSDLMYVDLPIVGLGTQVGQAVVDMAKGRMGCVGIVDSSGCIQGIFTDGDLRRSIVKDHILNAKIEDVMSKQVKTLKPDMLAEEAGRIMDMYSIPSIFVCDRLNKPVGIVHMRDLVKIGFGNALGIR